MEEKKVLNLNLDDVLPNRFQPRIRFNEEAINELAESIKKHGVIQPIVVRTIGDKYEIIAGERRFKASSLAGKTTIPAIIADLDDRNSAEVALIENVQREDLTPIEEATSYKKILDMGYLTQSELAQKLGKEQSTVANKLRLLNLHDNVQEALLDEEISERHARSLLRLDKEQQDKLLSKIISERLTVRKTDQEIDKILEVPVKKPIETVDFTVGSGEKEMPEVINFDSQIEEVSNPGFVDVEKIENEAKDIYVEAPAVDMSTLINEVEQPVDLTPRKFFTFLPQDEVVAEPPKVEEVFNKFEFEEVNNVAPIQPVVEAPIVNNVVVEEPFKFDFNEIETPITAAPIVNDVVVEEPFKFDFNEVETPVVEAPIVNDVVVEEPFKFDFNKVSVEPTQTVETPLIARENDNSFKFNFEEPVENVVTAKPLTPITEDIYADIIDDIAIETKPSEVVVSYDMKSVISAIRECASKIEKFGYVVDTDEFDFTDMYQVIIKVNKK